jgi:type I restriction enzyme, S subunit
MKIVYRSLNELGYVKRGKSKHRPRDAEFLYNGPYPFIQTSDVKNAGLYITDYSQTYSMAGLAQSKLWKTGTLCITIAANICDTAILSFDACFPDSIIGFIPDIEKSDAKYIKYLFDAILQKRFKRFTQGAAQDNLSQEKLLSLKLPIPEDVNYQKSIADIISTYDNLILINRRRIHLLEESAHLLYREWFVNFRFPGHEKVKIIDGIPEGWEKLQVKDIIRTFNSRKKIHKSAYEKVGLYPCVDQSQEFISGFTNRKDYVVNRNASIVVFGDHTRIIKYIDFPFVSGADGTQILASTHDNISSEFLYFILKNINLSNYFYARHFKFLKDQWVLIPKDETCKLFDLFSKNIMKQISVLRNQNQKLSQARDLLLPKLMSGEIEV